MPNRILRDGILTSPRVAPLTWGAELFYRKLHSVVDDFGRYHAHPMLLRAACYPLQLDRLNDDDVETFLQECVQTNLVILYVDKGSPYLEVVDFKQKVRQVKSRFPAPQKQVADEQDTQGCRALADGEESDQPLSDNCGTGEGPSTYAYAKLSCDPVEQLSCNPVEDAESNASTRAKRARSHRVPLPTEFEISLRVKQWAEKNGFDRLPEHLEAFTNKALARGYQYIDWDSAFMEAIREDWAHLRNGNGPMRGSRTQQLIANNAAAAKEWVSNG